jgi:hypothetical protein
MQRAQLSSGTFREGVACQLSEGYDIIIDILAKLVGVYFLNTSINRF